MSGVMSDDLILCTSQGRWAQTTNTLFANHTTQRILCQSEDFSGRNCLNDSPSTVSGIHLLKHSGKEGTESEIYYWGGKWHGKFWRALMVLGISSAVVGVKAWTIDLYAKIQLKLCSIVVGLFCNFLTNFKLKIKHSTIPRTSFAAPWSPNLPLHYSLWLCNFTYLPIFYMLASWGGTNLKNKLSPSPPTILYPVDRNQYKRSQNCTRITNSNISANQYIKFI
jgi:hypothetical protein